MRILFVENHAVFAAQVCQQFPSAHAVKVIVPSLAAAREALAAEEYHLLLSDYDLDDGKGDELVRECRGQRPQLPVIAVSAREAGNTALLQAGAWAAGSKMEFHKIQTTIEMVNR